MIYCRRDLRQRINYFITVFPDGMYECINCVVVPYFATLNSDEYLAPVCWTISSEIRIQ